MVRYVSIILGFSKKKRHRFKIGEEKVQVERIFEFFFFKFEMYRNARREDVSPFIFLVVHIYDVWHVKRNDETSKEKKSYSKGLI